jgi:hypothetical protein
MHSQKFRKLNVDLPRQALINQRPWFIAGVVAAIVIVLISAFTFFGNLKQRTSRNPQRKKVLTTTNINPRHLLPKTALETY